MSSYEFTRFGTLEGTLRQVSATTFSEGAAGGASGEVPSNNATNNSSNANTKVYYLGVVRLSRNYVGKTPGENLVLPGMAVDANIVTGEKTLLQYVLGPVYRAVESSFKER